MTIALENQFSLLQPDWVQLTPLGEFPHSRGLQRVDATAVETMVRNFRSLGSRVGRLFGGLPFYVGHPDNGASESADNKAYGWITQLEARANGLYGFVKWSEPGLELLRNGHYKFFSPFWEAEEVASGSGQRIYRPVALLSVGLTNQPNIPVNPLANVQELVSAPNLQPGLAMHVTSVTTQLRFRRDETITLANKSSRLQELVRGKMAAGATYDDAWQQVKTERPLLFRQLTT